MSVDMPRGYLGSDSRITSGPAPELVATGYALEVADGPLLHAGFGLADMAHVLALREAQVIPEEAATLLLRELLSVHALDASDFPYLVEYGDAYNSRERELSRRVGPSAGWLHTGRTRREAGRIAFRIALRQKLLDLHDAIGDLVLALAAAARRHSDDLWADTTYLQPAQPSTFGHYLGAFAEEASRHLERVRMAYEWANRSPAGCGGVGGSPLLPDRAQEAAVLGFDGPGLHTRDVMWSIDGLIDAVVAATQAATTADRLAEDLEIFASPGFGYVSLDASLCRASVLLPQKRNPYALAVIRSGANLLIGRTTGLLATQRTPSARTDNWLHAYGEVASALSHATRLMKLSAVVVATLEVDTEALRRASAANFTGAADLAEWIVVHHGLDYRTAYRVVGRAVAAAIAANKDILNARDLNSAAQALGVDLEVDVEVEGVLDARSIVSTRDVLGGSAGGRVREHADHVEQLAGAAWRWSREARQVNLSAEEEVLRRSKVLAQAGSDPAGG